MMEIPAGEFMMGNDSIEALDNERSRHQVYLETYWIDRYPVTCRQYREFIEAGGYQNEHWWSPDGWKWLQENPVAQPLYWSTSPAWDNHPVCGVSWYEADAYALQVLRRLGRSPHDAFTAFMQQGMLQDTATHPGTRKRVAQLRMLAAAK